MCARERVLNRLSVYQKSKVQRDAECQIVSEENCDDEDDECRQGSPFASCFESY